MHLVENLADAQTLAQAIVNTIQEPFLVLDGDLRVLAASRSFYETFKVNPDGTRGSLLYALGDGQWDIPALRTLLETIIPERTSMDGFEVSHDFPKVGHRTMLLNARKVRYDDPKASTILLAFTDVTDRRKDERDKAALQLRTDELLLQKHVLLQEMEHRVANSLQIIASILMLKAMAATSNDAQTQLKDAHQRVMSVAAVQRHLHNSGEIDKIEVRSYLIKLVGSLSDSMIGDSQPISVQVTSDETSIKTSSAVSIGLIITELLINTVKYAFPVQRVGAAIMVSFEIHGDGWRLSVSDNGIGKAEGAKSSLGGLGTTIVRSLVQQLDATMVTRSSPEGLSIVITHTGPAALKLAS
jgi:chemotaxis protein methyltransferase CheR